MKRDMDLVREIMLQIEASPTIDDWIDIKIDDRKPEEVLYHVILLEEAGLIKAEDLSTLGGKDIRPTGLTWDGHQFVEAARDDTRWGKARDILNKAGAWTIQFAIQVITEIAKDQARGLLGQHNNPSC